MKGFPPKKSILGNHRGQIVVEYVLLLMIGAGLAAAIQTAVASRSPDNPGFLVAKWAQIVMAIGIDPADDLVEETDDGS